VISLCWDLGLHVEMCMFVYLFIYLFIFTIQEYTVADFKRTRRVNQISLRMVVSHHVVAGI
jgi:hypothetical protein